MTSRRRALLSLAIAAGGNIMSAQDVERVLPGGTGSVSVLPGWTFLDAEAIAAPQRSTDPSSEPLRSLLAITIEGLRTVPHPSVLLYSIGPTERLRTVHAYAVDGAIGTQWLQSKRLVTSMRETMERQFGAGGADARFVESDSTSFGGVGGIRLRFDVRRDERRQRVDVHLVPAGPATQWFVAACAIDDTGAAEEIERLLHTFKGARDVAVNAGEDGFDSAKNAILLGAMGALGGAVVLMIRRKTNTAGRWRRRRHRGASTPDGRRS